MKTEININVEKKLWDFCIEFTKEKGDNSLQAIVKGFEEWGGVIAIYPEIRVGRTSSFHFVQSVDGKRNLCGGIINHGEIGYKVHLYKCFNDESKII